jgi:hypothetical protein
MIGARFSVMTVAVVCTIAGCVKMTASIDQHTMVSLRATEDVAPETDPSSAFWASTPPVYLRLDTYGKPYADRPAEVRSRWTDKYLYFLFVCPYNELYLKPDPQTSVETNQLWKWDVAEVFIGSNFKDIQRYKEFELSPQGEWVDLDINLHIPHHEDGWLWNSGFKVAARIDHASKVWYGAMRIPFAAIAPEAPHAGTEFRMNLFRTEGPPGSSQRHITWQPSMANTFHKPERFGLLKLSGSTDK